MYEQQKHQKKMIKKVCEDYNGNWLKYDDGDRYCKIDNEKDQQMETSSFS
jgi:hypothetical protein